MKSKHVVTAAKSGAIYVPKLTTKYLGILDWAGVVIAVEEKYIYMRFYKQSITTKEGELVVKLQKKSGGRLAMTGWCRKFSEAIKSDFGDANYLDLHIKTMFANEESVRISLDRPSRKDEESTHGFAAGKDAGCEDKAEANKNTTGKDAQVKVARWIRANGCAEISCRGTGGRFDGIACPLRSSRYGCGWMKSEERKTAEDWLVSNGYPLDQETRFGTISSPITEKQLDIFSHSGKPARAPRTRPLPDGLPEWLSGPLSRGEQVRIIAFTEKKEKGWVFGAFIDEAFGKNRPVAVVEFDNRDEPSFCLVEDIAPCLSRLKPASECLSVAKSLKIGLSPMQIEAIINDGVTPENHGLPDEMFE